MIQEKQLIGGQPFPEWRFRDGVNHRKALKEKHRLRSLFRKGFSPDQLGKRIKRLLRMKESPEEQGAQNFYPNDFSFVVDADRHPHPFLEGTELPDALEIAEIRIDMALERWHQSMHFILDHELTYLETALYLDEHLAEEPALLTAS